jgi:hypothetical protein
MAENSIISNPDYEEMVRNGEALSRLTSPDTEDQQIAREMAARAIKHQLMTLDELNPADYDLAEYDVVPITMTKKGGSTVEVGWPIKSIPSKKMDELNKAYQDVMIKVPRRRNPQTGQMEPDDTHKSYYTEYLPQYQQAQNDFAYRKLLEGTNMVIMDEDRNIVWDPNDKKHQYFDRAMESLDRMGIRINQMRAINLAIDKLSVTLAVEEAEDFLQE